MTERRFYGSGNDAFCFEWSPDGYRVPYERKEISTIKQFLGQCVAYLVEQKEVSACVVSLNTGQLLLAREGSRINALHIESRVRADAKGKRGEPIVYYKQHKFFAPDEFMDRRVARALKQFDFATEPTARITEFMAGARRVTAFH